MPQLGCDRKDDNNRSVINMIGMLILITLVFIFFVWEKGENFGIKAIDSRLWLGVETIELTPDVKAQYDLLDSNGILVARTFVGSPAQLAGIMEGDVIQRWNGISITSQEQFQQLIQTSDLNDRITFTVDRQGQQALVYGQVGIRPGGV
ncbi:MAG: PDZ domain-containing protein [Candidatus Omnitrophica bacterium]|nr:PDZ domain-containing protein [Candidatus Omnitrophota bacterium]